MQKINIHFRKNINKGDIENKVRVVLESSEIYKSDTQIIILEEEGDVTCFNNPLIKICCELFAYENKNIEPKENILKLLFNLMKEEYKLDLSNMSGIIHQLDKDHYITNSEKITVEKLYREDSFKTLGI